MSMPAAWALATSVRQRELAPARVVEAALASTDLLIGADGIGVFLHVDGASARRAASDVQQRLAQGEDLPLASVPLALSDDVAQAGQPQGCASLGRRGQPADQTAPTVARLEQAGAVVIGRTNMDELGLGASTEQSGYHSTINPWDAFRSPGGAAGGAAAAVAMGAVSLAVAGDRVGDSLHAAACCGVVAFRPGWEGLERGGLHPVAPSLETLAPMARTVRDAALALGLMLDQADLVGAVEAPVDGRSVGLLMEAQGRDVEAALKARFSAGMAALEDAGLRLRPVSAPALRFAGRAAQLVLAAEAVPALAPLADRLGPGARRTLLLGQYLHSDAGRALLQRAQDLRVQLGVQLHQLFDQVDALALPTMPTVAPHFHEELIDLLRTQALVAPAALAGLPALTVPVGMADLGLGIKMPAGLQLIGRPDDEAGLLPLGAAVEARLGPLPVPPKLRL